MGLVAIALVVFLLGVGLYLLLRLLLNRLVTSKRNQFLIYNCVALVFIAIAMFFSWIWAFYIVILYCYPSMLIAYLCTRQGAKILPNQLFSKINYGLNGLALVLSIIALKYFSI